MFAGTARQVAAKGLTINKPVAPAFMPPTAPIALDVVSPKPRHQR